MRISFDSERIKDVLMQYSIHIQDKHIKWNKPLYMAFIDQAKAFDRVVRAELWKCLEERGNFGELFRAVSLYICSQAAVRIREG